MNVQTTDQQEATPRQRNLAAFCQVLVKELVKSNLDTGSDPLNAARDSALASLAFGLAISEAAPQRATAMLDALKATSHARSSEDGPLTQDEYYRRFMAVFNTEYDKVPFDA
jgi:hypothetical protein